MERMKQAAQYLASHTAVFVIIAAIIAFFMPQLFGWVKGTNQIIILFIIMFSMGLTLTLKDFKVLAARPFDIFIGAAAQYLIMPFSAYFLSKGLGLSDEIQASAGGVKLDTMFVDEGFGSLDEESLDQALRALVSLAEGNRLVGIISHVAELKNRIDKRIVVKKDQSGGSRATIII